jgi:hypothetical protein
MRYGQLADAHYTILNLKTCTNIVYSEEFLTGAQSLFLMNSISATTDTGVF